jgi:hypothetical protein
MVHNADTVRRMLLVHRPRCKFVTTHQIAEDPQRLQDVTTTGGPYALQITQRSVDRRFVDRAPEVAEIAEFLNRTGNKARKPAWRLRIQPGALCLDPERIGEVVAA